MRVRLVHEGMTSGPHVQSEINSGLFGDALESVRGLRVREALSLVLLTEVSEDGDFNICNRNFREVRDAIERDRC